MLAPSHSTLPAQTGTPAVPLFAAPHVPLAVPDCLSVAAHASHAAEQSVLQQ